MGTVWGADTRRPGVGGSCLGWGTGEAKGGRVGFELLSECWREPDQESASLPR